MIQIASSHILVAFTRHLNNEVKGLFSKSKLSQNSVMGKSSAMINPAPPKEEPLYLHATGESPDHTYPTGYSHSGLLKDGIHYLWDHLINDFVFAVETAPGEPAQFLYKEYSLKLIED